MKDIFISMEIYLIASFVAVIIAGLIKGMLAVTRSISSKKKEQTNESKVSI